MSRKKVLVAYASVSGSTAEVAAAIGEVLGGEGVAVEVLPVKAVDDLDLYEAVVLGSSIRAGRWLPEAFAFLEKHKAAMSQRPVAYFTTCLTMVNDTEANRQLVLDYMAPVQLAAPEIKPVGLGLFAGSLDPARAALPMLNPDLAPQGDYRDWEAIRAWAAEIKPLLSEVPGGGAPVVLRHAILSYTDLSGTDLREVDLHGAELDEADLRQANLQGADLGQTKLTRADLSRADLHEATAQWAELNRANLTGANLVRANLIGADLSRANLDQADLRYAVLNGANLSQANLRDADLRRADLNWTDLRKADLSQANLSQANLGWANFSDANLDQAILTGALYNDATQWPEGFSPRDHGGIRVDKVK
ncbi:MAG TPA: pentapeptide repeat-containing protein [Anaerolineae bacterium]|nr:pentapeptide repeat-containing protein [Anaerolineae bacterium]